MKVTVISLSTTSTQVKQHNLRLMLKINCLMDVLDGFTKRNLGKFKPGTGLTTATTSLTGKLMNVMLNYLSLPTMRAHIRNMWRYPIPRLVLKIHPSKLALSVLNRETNSGWTWI